MKLSNLRMIGRHINPDTGKAVNVHKGRNTQRGTDILFFYRSGVRVAITDRDFYSSDKWKPDTKEG